MSDLFDRLEQERDSLGDDAFYGKYPQLLKPRKFYDPPRDIGNTVFDPFDETFGPIMAAIQTGNFAEAAGLLSQLEDRS